MKLTGPVAEFEPGLLAPQRGARRAIGGAARLAGNGGIHA